jgi:hypothetical protein
MGAFVQAIDIIGKDFHPGQRSRCPACIGNASQHENLCVSPTQPENITGAAAGLALKKTKNNILDETLMWKFSVVLHHCSPQEIGSYLDGIRALTERMAREKENGVRSDFPRSKRWNPDVRIEQLKEVLRTMVLDCARHGVEACACGKHCGEAWDVNFYGVKLTPPSSSTRTSPMAGRKRSREASEEEDRRVRQRHDMFFARL